MSLADSIDARAENLNRRSLDRKYQPSSLDEAIDIIDILRDICVIAQEKAVPIPYGLTKQEFRLFSFLLARGSATHDQLNFALYGAGYTFHTHAVVKTLLTRIKRKIDPKRFVITNIYAIGYALTEIKPIQLRIDG